MDVLHVDFRASWVLLSAAISFMGTYTAFAMCEQVRIALLSDRDKPKRKLSLLVLVAMSLGGVGFFGSFYTGSLSMRLRTDHNSIIWLMYDPDLVTASAFVTTAVTLVGLYVASTDECYCRTKSDIMEMFIMRASKTMTIGEIKRMGKSNILFRVCTDSLGPVLLGGIISGGALALQEYVGVLSFSIRGDVRMDQGYLAGALICCFVGVPFTYWLFFRVLSVFTEYDIVRVACTGCGLGVMLVVHFITLVGVRFHYDPDAHFASNSTPPGKIVVGVLTTTVLFSFFMVMSVLTDLRAWLVRASVQLSMADTALLSLLNKPAAERLKPSASTGALSALNDSAHGTSARCTGGTATAGTAAALMPATLSEDNSMSNADFNRAKSLPTPVIHYAARYLGRFVELSEVSMVATGTEHPLHRRRGSSTMASPRESPGPRSEGHKRISDPQDQRQKGQSKRNSGSGYARLSPSSTGAGLHGETSYEASPSQSSGSGKGVSLKVLRSGSKIYPTSSPIEGTSSGSPKQPTLLSGQPSRSGSPLPQLPGPDPGPDPGHDHDYGPGADAAPLQSAAVSDSGLLSYSEV